MKKRLTALVLAFAMVLILMTGCSGSTSAETDVTGNGRFVLVSESDIGNETAQILVDTETKVEYLYVRAWGSDSSSGGGLTIIVDENGAPVLWEGDL